MDFRVYFYILGLFTLFQSLLHLPAIADALYLSENVVPFVFSFLFTFIIGSICVYFHKRNNYTLPLMTGVYLLPSLWIWLAFFGMLPFVFSGMLVPLDAFFESISSLTTTGMDIIHHTNAPSSLILWRDLLKWSGGLYFAIMLLTVFSRLSPRSGSILSMSSRGIFRPSHNRMLSISLDVFKIYSLLSLIILCLFYLAGFPIYSSLKLALRTVSTAGAILPSTIQSLPLSSLILCIIAILIGGSNLMFYHPLFKKNYNISFKNDKELHIYLASFFVIASLFAIHMYSTKYFDLTQSVKVAFFYSASFLSTTGFATKSIANFPEFDKFLMLLLLFFGGCIGSMGGGFRIFRLIVLFKTVSRGIRQMVHPHQISDIRLGKNLIPVNDFIYIPVLFFSYIFIMFVSSAILSLDGFTMTEALGISISCLTSAGSGAMIYGINEFSTFSPFIKTFSIILMIIGRCEIFPVMIMFFKIKDRIINRW